MDVGLILSVLGAFVLASALAWYRAPTTEPTSLLETAVWPLIIGVVIGRMSSQALEDPSSITNLRDVASLRGGVEFWPGLAAAVVAIGVAARRRCVGVLVRLADLAPYGLAGVAGYQAACFVREGCFGPASAVGLRPDAFHTAVFPVEVAGAMVLVGVSVWMVRNRERRTPTFTLVGVVSVLAVQRAVISIWLPAIGDDLSRAHLSSIAVAAVSLPVLAVVTVHSRFRLVVTPAGGPA